VLGVAVASWRICGTAWTAPWDAVANGHGPLRPPPWLRVVVTDLATGDDVPNGEVGCLRFFDLANLGSVVAIQTEDVGRVRDGGIELLGRAPGAVTRGCSLLASGDRA